MKRKPHNAAIRYAAPVLAALLLLGMGLGNLSFPAPEDAEAYHEQVRAIRDAAPLDFGPWEGRTIDLPASAVQLLKPNAILSRSFVDSTARRRAEFMVVQCKDARDLSGHWPPNCYKTSGYTLTAQFARTWTVGGVTFPGVEYHFELETAYQRDRIVVANFMILPEIGYVPDMHSVREAGADYRRRYFGAAQVQVVTDAAYTDEMRDEMFKEVLAPHLPLIQKIVDPDADPI